MRLSIWKARLLWSLKKKRNNEMLSVNASSVFTVMKMTIDRFCWVSVSLLCLVCRRLLDSHYLVQHFYWRETLHEDPKNNKWEIFVQVQIKCSSLHCTCGAGKVKNNPTLLFSGLLDQDLQEDERTDVRPNLLVGIYPLVKFHVHWL